MKCQLAVSELYHSMYDAAQVIWKAVHPCGLVRPARHFTHGFFKLTPIVTVAKLIDSK
jgi:hypothetical protein